jgi:hypothetical protein
VAAVATVSVVRKKVARSGIPAYRDRPRKAPQQAREGEDSGAAREVGEAEEDLRGEMEAGGDQRSAGALSEGLKVLRL